MRARRHVPVIPFAGQFEDDPAWNEKTGKRDERKVKVGCPTCKRINAPLTSRRTASVQFWTEEPVFLPMPCGRFRAVCRWCGMPYEFNLCTPARTKPAGTKEVEMATESGQMAIESGQMAIESGKGDKDWNPKRGTDPRLRHGGLAPSSEEYRERQEKRREAEAKEREERKKDDGE